MTAVAQLERIVSLVAELSRVDDEDGRSLADLAGRYSVSPKQIAKDIETLTTLCDHAEAEWLLSLSAWQQDDRVSVTSLGPFRRPILLTPDERLALQVALALDPEGAGLAARLASALEGAARQPSGGPPVRRSASLAEVLLSAAAQHHAVEVLYAGEAGGGGRRSVIEPHELVGFESRTYVHAWDREGQGWRMFRLDRFLDALPTGDAFEERDDFVPVRGRADLFRAPASAVEHVRVRFSPQVARWVRERYPGCADDGNGGVIVTFLATSVEWLVRRVLEYGPEAEVLEPAAYREAVRRAVA